MATFVRRIAYAILHFVYKDALWYKNRKEKVVYLTFDDAPCSEYTLWVLDKLDELNIKATFFCIGKNVEANRSLFLEIKRRGHSIGVHGYNHRRKLFLSSENFYADVNKARGFVDSNIFRPPYGQIFPWQVQKLKKQGLQVVLWDIISLDYDSSIAEDKILARCTSRVQNGSIVVFHDSVKASKNMCYAFPKFVEYCKKQGYKFDKL